MCFSCMYLLKSNLNNLFFAYMKMLYSTFKIFRVQTRENGKAVIGFYREQVRYILSRNNKKYSLIL